MNYLKKTYLMPHPPIIIPEIGNGEERKIQSTIDSMNKIAAEIQEIKPETILIITPHGTLFRDAISINYDKILQGNFKTFGNYNLDFKFENDLDLVDTIVFNAGREDVLTVKIDDIVKEDYAVDSKIDHGVLVPLYFIDKHYKKYKLVHITYGLLSKEELYRFGMSIQKSISELGRKSVVIASGDLSHKLSKTSNIGYHPDGLKFDKSIMEFISYDKREEIMKLDYSFAERAGECGLRSIQIMLGVLDGFKTNNKVLSYEGPFGVGYGCASFNIIYKDKESNILEKVEDLKNIAIRKIREKEDEYVTLARETLESYILKNTIINVPNNLKDKSLYNNKAGVFVSIKKNGDLRGCIGTIESTKDCIAHEIIGNAINSGTRDPRFYPITENELNDLVYTVDVLMPAEKIQSTRELDVYKYGVIVKKGSKTGLLLPNLDGIDTPEEQVRIALKKAGISPDDDYEMERFEVIRHS